MDAKLISLLNEQYNWIYPNFKPLRGYAIRNTLVEDQGEKMILKEYDLKECSVELLIEESRIICEPYKRHRRLFPKPIKNKSGEYAFTIKSKAYKVFSYLEGQFFAEENHSNKLISSFGKALGKMNLELLNHNSNSIKAQVLDWDI